MSEILGDKLNIIYEGTLLEITPELLKKTILKQNEEIERLNKQIEEYQKALDEITSEKIDLENIIKEVRNRTIKMIANSGLDFMYRKAYKDILETLDKENKK